MGSVGTAVPPVSPLPPDSISYFKMQERREGECQLVGGERGEGNLKCTCPSGGGDLLASSMAFKSVKKQPRNGTSGGLACLKAARYSLKFNLREYTSASSL